VVPPTRLAESLSIHSSRFLRRTGRPRPSASQQVEHQQGGSLAGDGPGHLAAQPAREVGQPGFDLGPVKPLGGQIGHHGHQQGRRRRAADREDPQRIEQLVPQFAPENLVEGLLDLLAQLPGLAVVLAGLALGSEVLTGIDPVVIVQLITVRAQPRARFWLECHETLFRERMIGGHTADTPPGHINRPDRESGSLALKSRTNVPTCLQHGVGSANGEARRHNRSEVRLHGSTWCAREHRPVPAGPESTETPPVSIQDTGQPRQVRAKFWTSFRP